VLVAVTVACIVAMEAIGFVSDFVRIPVFAIMGLLRLLASFTSFTSFASFAS
jgi:hypothetical protein